VQAQAGANSASSSASQYAQSETSANASSAPASTPTASSNPSLYAGASSGSVPAPAGATTGPNMHQMYNSGMYQHQHHAHHDLYAAGGAVKCRISFFSSVYFSLSVYSLFFVVANEYWQATNPQTQSTYYEPEQVNICL
jgi:hypothetical protein